MVPNKPESTKVLSDELTSSKADLSSVAVPEMSSEGAKSTKPTANNSTVGSKDSGANTNPCAELNETSQSSAELAIRPAAKACLEGSDDQVVTDKGHPCSLASTNELNATTKTEAFQVAIDAAQLPPNEELQGEAGFIKLLSLLKNNSTHTKEQGLSFELLVSHILASAQPWCERFSKVQLYAQWAQEHPQLADTSRDLGIDLVAVNTALALESTGLASAKGISGVDLSALCPDAPFGFTAIQCKFFTNGNAIAKDQIDSFIAESNRPCFTSRLLVHTSKIGENAQYAIKHCVPAVQTVGLHDLAQANLDWAQLLKEGDVKLTKRQLRPYQQDALKAVVEGLKEHQRGQLIMACGTGKTFTALKIAETMVKSGGSVLFLVPSLALLSQSLTDWKRQTLRPMRSFAVCSDQKVGQSKKERNEELIVSLMRPSELDYPVTTDAAKLSQAMRTPFGPEQSNGLNVVFATYHSLDVIYQAQHSYALPAFDLIICDEAHRTASGYLKYEHDLAIASSKGFTQGAVSQAKQGGEQIEAEPNRDAAPNRDADQPAKLRSKSKYEEEGPDDKTVAAEALHLKQMRSSKRAVAQRTRALFGNESTWTRIHNNSYIGGKKRLYMTATPKIFGANAKEQEAKGEVILYSMDDERVFGPVLYTLNFDMAVKLGCLVDFKVIILAADKELFPSDAKLFEFSKKNSAKVIGSWKALNKYGLSGELGEDNTPMKRALAFAQVIDAGRNLDKAGSKQFQQNFPEVIEKYRAHLEAKHQLAPDGPEHQEYVYIKEHPLRCECHHLDGTMNALDKEAELDWLRAEPLPDICKVLFNVRCLSEGVDVTNLDAVIFLSPRQSQVEVVQIVGRVMRKAQGKKRGYVIIPIVTNDTNNPESVFTKNKDFETVWQIVGALRSLNPDHVLVDGVTGKIDPRIEVVCVQSESICSRLQAVPGLAQSNLMTTPKSQKSDTESAHPEATSSPNQSPEPLTPAPLLTAENAEITSPQLPAPNLELELDDVSKVQDPWDELNAPKYQQRRAKEWERQRVMEIEHAIEIESSIRSLIVKRVGKRKEWEEWGEVVAQMCAEQRALLTKLLSSCAYPEIRTKFQQFALAFNAAIKQSLSQDDLVELLAQHMVIKPILSKLFPYCDFAERNPISRALSNMLTLLDPEGVVRSGERLQAFYQSLEFRMANVSSVKECQMVVLDLFERFFKVAFPKLQAKLGVVYTPLEIVDFINNSVQEILEREFGTNLSQPQVHILDPFTGTGTFIARLLQNPKLITPEAREYKYRHDLHAFELMPLAYYIASINIEATYQELTHHDADAYEPNNVVSLTDTFVTDQSDGVVANTSSALLQDDKLKEAVACLDENGARRTTVNHLPLQVILGNPPYSMGQVSQNDDNQNEHYPHLEQRISETYGALTPPRIMKRALYDSYVKALRWASDHIGDQGVIAFVSNGSWLENLACVGLRRSLYQEFSAVYVLDLKGKRRTIGEANRKQGKNIFGDGCRTAVAITILVKNPRHQGPADIFVGAIPDYLNLQEKRNQLAVWGSIFNVPLTKIIPDQYGDWLNQRREDFAAFLPMETHVSKKEQNTASGKLHGIFANSSDGILSGRDAWAYNASRYELERSFARCIGVLNAQIDAAKKAKSLGINFERSNDSTKIKWDKPQLTALVTGEHFAPMNPRCIRMALYRPFIKTYLYYDPQWLSRTYRTNFLFPEPDCENQVIVVIDKHPGFSCLMSKLICDYGTMRLASHCFPRYLYIPKRERTEPTDVEQPSWTQRYDRIDAISPAVVAYFAAPYGDDAKELTADDVFYYIYGILHSKDYVSCYQSNLQKERPRIPRVARWSDFMAFSESGRKLAQLHLNFEELPAYQGCQLLFAKGVTPENMDYRVERLRYGCIKGQKGLAAIDRSIICYNRELIIKNIPAGAHDYQVGRQSPLDWVVERMGVSIDKESKIINDYNQFALEQGKPHYILESILRAITVGIESSAVIAQLPPLEIHPWEQRRM